MNKKSLLMMMVTICLIAVVGVGATLAYLTDTSDTLTNTFTVGKGIKVSQDESNEATEDPTDRTTSGNTYANILPGAVLTKDPTAIVLADSTECYVFMKLEGADQLVENNFSFDGFNKQVWVPVNVADGKLDGVYRYYETVKTSTEDQRLDSLFTSVKYSEKVESVADVSLEVVTIKTCAVQAANLDAQGAFNATVWEK